MAVVTADVPSADALTRCSTNLTRSFALCAAMFVLSLIAPAVMRPPYAGRDAIVAGLLSLTFIGAYIWYAVAAGAAAKALGGRRWTYVVWILAAPVLSVVLSRVPIVGTLIVASPLSIKFLLGNQLDAALRAATATHLHRS